MPAARVYTPIILAGGLGTRLAGALPDLPKALAPVRGRPFISFLLDALAQANFQETVICTGYRAGMMADALGARHGRLHLRYAKEETLHGTGGALRFAVSAVQSAWCLILNGDSFCEVDFAEFLAWHVGRAEPVGLVLTEVGDAGRYGHVAADAGGHIHGFREKDPVAGGGWINAGIYSVPTRLIETLPAGRVLSLEREAFPRWLTLGMAGFRSTGEFIDIGTPEGYRAAEAFFIAHTVPGGMEYHE